MSDIESWWAGGRHHELTLDGAPRQVFVRRDGDGPSATLIHGFPSSSHDWAKVAPALAAERALLMPDLLGFGASDKPPAHTYTLMEQADLVEEVWAADGVVSTDLVAHDYGVTVAQELLARRAEGTLTVELRSVHFLNGGLYPDLHRPVDAQVALADPETGPQIVANLTPEIWDMVLAPTFAPGYDAAGDGADIWAATARGGIVVHRTIAYMAERAQHAQRWVGALEETDVPRAFTWGMLDPISGAHVADRLRERLPGDPFTALHDVAHWPPLEAPERVARALLAHLVAP